MLLLPTSRRVLTLLPPHSLSPPLSPPTAISCKPIEKKESTKKEEKVKQKESLQPPLLFMLIFCIRTMVCCNISVWHYNLLKKIEQSNKLLSIGMRM